MRFVTKAVSIILFAVLAKAATAGVVSGTYSGTVYDQWGTLEGQSLSEFAGARVVGGFTYLSEALDQSWGTDGVTYNAAYAFGSPNPLRIWGSISTDTSSLLFDIDGNSLSEVYAARDFVPATYPNWLYMQASRVDTTGVFLQLYDLLGQHFVEDVSNLGTVGYSATGDASYGVVNFNSGAISFSIESSTASNDGGGAGASLPEPSSIALVAIAGLLAVRQRVRRTCGAS